MSSGGEKTGPKQTLEGKARTVQMIDRSDSKGQYESTFVTFIIKRQLIAPAENPPLPEEIPIRILTGEHPPAFEGEQTTVIGSMAEQGFFEADSVFIPVQKYTIKKLSTSPWAYVFGVLFVIAIAIGLYEIWHSI